MGDVIAFPRRKRSFEWGLFGALLANFFIVIVFGLLVFEILRP
jgi:hypothetical protein